MMAEQLEKITLQIAPLKITLNDVSDRVGKIKALISRVDSLELDVEVIKDEIISLNKKIYNFPD